MNTALPSSTSLYAAHKKVYSREVTGRFARLRLLAVFLLLGLFYGVSWLPWNGRQAVLFDLPGRKFHIFALTFFPQDFILLTWLLVIAALSLFFFTALAGRLWCGYACPQTVWTEIYVWMERITEGNRSKQMKLDRGTWTAERLARKSAKQAMWIVFSAFTGFAFVGYFTPIRELTQHILSLRLGGWEWFWVLFYSSATYGNAGFLREQLCKYMCPYARFQSVMFDKSTLVIAYDAARGEPRGARNRANIDRLGDCIDCTLCVQVCPTGIDIRKGLQNECIACAACVDACDNVMRKVCRPTGLIRYSTADGDSASRRLLRPRIMVYGAVLSALIGGFAWVLTHRVPLNVDVLRDRNTLSRQLPDGRAENVYSVRIINKDSAPHEFKISAEGLDQITVDSDAPLQWVAAESVKSVVVRVRAPARHLSGGYDIRIITCSVDAPKLKGSTAARFFYRR
jgi:cytochrome c oxidase accessory protein FixG